MATNIEIEAKVLISQQDYLKVKDYFKDRVADEYTQHNYYIDTPDFDLRTHGAGLRIREVKNKRVITLKTPIAEGLLEKTEEISENQYNDMIKNGIIPETKIKTFLIMLGYDISKLNILASLSTDRIDVKVPEYTFSIDKNTYADTVDYELEREANNALQAQNDLISICEECKIAYTINKESKASRAMKYVYNNKKKVA